MRGWTLRKLSPDLGTQAEETVQVSEWVYHPGEGTNSTFWLRKSCTWCPARKAVSPRADTEQMSWPDWAMNRMHTGGLSWTPRRWSVPVNYLLTHHTGPEIPHKGVKFRSGKVICFRDDSPQNKFKRERGTRSHILGLSSQASEGKGLSSFGAGSDQQWKGEPPIWGYPR